MSTTSPLTPRTPQRTNVIKNVSTSEQKHSNTPTIRILSHDMILEWLRASPQDRTTTEMHQYLTQIKEYFFLDIKRCAEVHEHIPVRESIPMRLHKWINFDTLLTQTTGFPASLVVQRKARIKRKCDVCSGSHHVRFIVEGIDIHKMMIQHYTQTSQASQISQSSQSSQTPQQGSKLMNKSRGDYWTDAACKDILQRYFELMHAIWNLNSCYTRHHLLHSIISNIDTPETWFNTVEAEQCIMTLNKAIQQCSLPIQRLLPVQTNRFDPPRYKSTHNKRDELSPNSSTIRRLTFSRL